MVSATAARRPALSKTNILDEEGEGHRKPVEKIMAAPCIKGHPAQQGAYGSANDAVAKEDRGGP